MIWFVIIAAPIWVAWQAFKFIAIHDPSGKIIPALCWLAFQLFRLGLLGIGGYVIFIYARVIWRDGCPGGAILFALVMTGIFLGQFNWFPADEAENKSDPPGAAAPPQPRLRLPRNCSSR